MAKQIVVEVDTPTNGNYMFKPTGEVLRGHLDVKRDPVLLRSREVGNLPPIEGQMIVLDMTAKIGRVVDPLGTPEGRVVLAGVTQRLKNSGLDHREQSPKTDKTYHLNDEEVATWCYWMKRMVDTNLGRLVEGSFPSKLPADPQKIFYRDLVDGAGRSEVVKDYQTERPADTTTRQ